MRDKIVASLTQMNQRGEHGRVDPMGEVDASAHDVGHVARILQCLEALASRPCTVDSLTRELGVHRRTVLRTLPSMIELGYVGIVGQKNGQSLYRATLKPTTLAKGVTAGSDLREMSAPFVSRVRAAPSSRFGASSVRAAGHEVRAAAAELSAQLGGKVSTHVAAAG